MPTTNLKPRDFKIMEMTEIQGKSYDQVQKELGISRCTIARTKKKPEYRELVLAALEQRHTTAETFAELLIKKLNAQKTVFVRTDEEDNKTEITVDDNPTQMTALTKFGDILGVDAPKEFDLKHSMAAMSDEELQKAIQESAETLNGRVQHSIAGSYHAQDLIANTIAGTEPRMAERTGEPAVSPANT